MQRAMSVQDPPEDLVPLPADLPLPDERPLLAELRARLEQLDEHGLAGLERGLEAAADGDYTFAVRPALEPLGPSPQDPELRALIDLFNAMLERTQATAVAYESLRRQLASALGDHSCLPDLMQALDSLRDHCLTDLDVGLSAMADGDLTRRAEPVTMPLRAEAGHELGYLGEVFNDMLARSRTALRSYEAVREDLRESLGDRSCLAALRDRLHSLQRHCLRDLEEGLEAHAEGTALTRPIGPITRPLEAEGDAFAGDLAAVFNRALRRAHRSVEHLARLRDAPAGR
jgi:hypothetical protein